MAAMSSPPAGCPALVSIELGCPKCGGPFAVDDETRAVQCGHCGSLLMLETPQRDELYVLEGQVGGAAELVEILVEYRVRAQRAEIIHRYRNSDGEPPPEAFIQARLRAYEQKLRGVVRLLEARVLQVPYWHITGAVVQGMLGRVQQDVKATRVRAWAVEHTVPGYDPRRANLRDRGLRLDPSRALPLTVAQVAARGQFVPRVAVPEQRYRELEKWLGQRLDPEIEPITTDGRFLFARRILVYRPYWLGHLVTDKGPEWILFDGSFRTIAGYPGEPEVRALRALRDADPLAAGAEAYRRVLIVAPRCPECGHERLFDRRAVIEICLNCHRALRLATPRLAVAGYAHAADDTSDLDAEYLPFWRFALHVRLADGREAASVESWLRQLVPHTPPGSGPAAPHLFVPAFRLLGTEVGDRAFKDLSAWIHFAGIEARDSKVPLGGRPGFRSVSLTEDEASQLAPFVLLGLVGRPLANRLNALLVRKGLRDAQIVTREPTLLYLPFDRLADGVGRAEAGLRVPQLVLDGGPALDAQRVTVQSAVAAMDARGRHG
jgi:DNA-directed RNA polymerase subunit RPC12/RpoP